MAHLLRRAVTSRRSRAAPAAVIALAALTVLTAPPPAARAALSMCGNGGTAGAVRHVIWIFMENEGYSSVVGNPSAPYQNSTLGARCGLATNFHNESHGSLANYVAATSGIRVLGTDFVKDCLPNASAGYCTSAGDSIFAQAEAAGGSWRGYAEDMPGACNRSNAGTYVARHNPAVYFPRLSSCPRYDVPMGDLGTTTGAFYDDVAHGTLPSFSFVTPNQIDNAHDGTVAQGDAWLSKVVPLIVNGANYQSGDTVLFISNDEGCGGSCGPDYAINEDCTDRAQGTTRPSCRVPTFVVSPWTPAGTRDATFYTHYSMLRTAEELLGYPLLDQAANWPSMRAGFALGPQPTPSPAPRQFVANRSFETDLTGWTTLWNPANTVQSRVTASAQNGSWSMRIGTNSSSYTSGGFSDYAARSVASTRAGTAYTASAWVKPSTPNLTLCLRLAEYAGTGSTKVSQDETCTKVPTTSWTPLTGTRTASATADSLVLYVYVSSFTSSQSVLVDDLSLTAPS